MTFRTVVKEVALESDMVASFMPKPTTELPGSAMHTHFSLFEGENNIFYDPNAEYNLSITGRQFIAGILEHANEISAVTNQYVNSYKRIWSGAEAPSFVCWGVNNRSAMIRIPTHKPGKGKSTRIELRTLDSACNPYLAFAVILAAGLDGIERKLELAPETSDDVWELSEIERKAAGIKPLPNSLEHALAYMEKSELVSDALGEHIFNHFLRNKRDEWIKYRQIVTQFELDRLFMKV
jgi:glutamine synthetase